MDYKFSFRKRDWTQVDEKKLAKKARKLEKKGYTPEQISAELGFSKDDIMEFFLHKVETEPGVLDEIKRMAAIEELGFERDELGYLINHYPEFGRTVRDLYDGPDYDEAVAIYGEETLEESAAKSKFCKLAEDEDDRYSVDVTAGLTMFLIQAGLSDGQIQFVLMMPDEFVRWVREHFSFGKSED